MITSNPPGETGTELFGADASAALNFALTNLTQSGRLHVDIAQVIVRPLVHRVLLTVVFRREGRHEDVKFNMSKAAARDLRDSLNKVTL